jgi:hypothetical protein
MYLIESTLDIYKVFFSQQSFVSSPPEQNVRCTKVQARIQNSRNIILY